MKTVYIGGEGEIVEKKSRFIATVRPVASEEEAVAFIAEMKKKYGAELQVLDLGGGYGVRYTDADPQVNIPENIEQLAGTIKSLCEELSLPMPAVLLEPGRSIVADAGLTIYTAGRTKSIPGYKNYVPVDGGMTDNPRYALYGSKYTVYLANRANEDADPATPR